MKIKKPIFVIGSGRSGSTILYNILSIHPDVCWFSSYSNRLARFPRLSLFHRILDLPIIGRYGRKKIINSTTYSPNIIWRFLTPSEGGKIYHDICDFKHCKRTSEDNINQVNHEKFKRIIRKHLEMTGKERFLSKQTANCQRIRLINKLFPNAYYIHLIRDGRAVTRSLMNVGFWDDTKIWWSSENSDWSTPLEWKQKGKDPIKIAAYHWKKDVKEILNNKHLFQNYLEVKYEDLTEDTLKNIEEIVHFCDLSDYKEFKELVPENLHNMNYKWQEQFSDKDKMKLNSILGEFLEKLGYNL